MTDKSSPAISNSIMAQITYGAQGSSPSTLASTFAVLREQVVPIDREGPAASTSRSHRIGPISAILEEALALADLDPDDDFVQSRSVSNSRHAVAQGRPNMGPRQQGIRLQPRSCSRARLWLSANGSVDVVVTAANARNSSSSLHTRDHPEDQHSDVF